MSLPPSGEESKHSQIGAAASAPLQAFFAKEDRQPPVTRQDADKMRAQIRGLLQDAMEQAKPQLPRK